MNIKRTYEACKRELRYQYMGSNNENGVGPLHIPCVLGPVGLGKTSMVRELAVDFALPLIQINAGGAVDGVDLTGVPMSIEHGTGGDWITKWAPNLTLHNAMAHPSLLHFDDVDKAGVPAQNALIGLLGERRFRDTVFHPKTLVVLSGNRAEDDMYARALSESIRTRATIIQLDPSAKDLVAWGKTTGLIHPLLCGYLMYKPEHVHVISTTGERHVTPRGYREASDQLRYEEESVWSEILALKLGSSVAADIMAYHDIYSRVDVPYLLENGVPAKQASMSDSDRRRHGYAAVFAIASHLNHMKALTKAKAPGLPVFIEKMRREVRMAFLMQLDPKVRARIIKLWPEEGKQLLESLVLSC